MSTRPQAEKIDDVGEYIPYARKHLEEHSGFKQQGGVSLKSLWPEPDWVDWVEEGVDVGAVASMAMIYGGLSTCPIAGVLEGEVTDEMWREGYIEAIAALRKVFEGIWLDRHIKEIERRFAIELGLDYETVTQLPFSITYKFYALRRTKGRRFKGPASLSQRSAMMAKWLPKLGWPESSGAITVSKFPMKFTDGLWRICHFTSSSITLANKETYLTDEEALVDIRAIIGRETTPEVSRIPVKPGGAKTDRQGPEQRSGQDMSAEQLMDDFGFRGIQFGASIGQKERQRWVNAVYDAIADMADLLSIDRTWIGGQKIQALAIGARGIGGTRAHYEPELKVTNLTRARGAGSFAHEWGHGIDNILCEMVYGTNRMFSKLVHQGWEVEPVHRALWNAMRNITEQLTGKDEKTSSFRQHAYWIEREHRAGRYWSTIEELFARGFEAFIQDSLLGRGIVSPWLVYGTLEADYDLNNIAGCPYPTGMERVLLNDLYAELVYLIEPTLFQTRPSSEGVWT